MKLQIDVSGLTKKLTDLEKRQLPFALSQALNRTAEAAQRSATAALNTFDRPTPFTLKSVYVKRTNKAQFLSGLAADVYLRNEVTKGTPPVKYLEPEVIGGSRRRKRFERALTYAGLLGPNEYAMPGQFVKLNSYGNVSAGTITSILSQLKASPDPLQNVTARSAKRLRRQGKRLYFTPRPGSRLPPGVYVRFGPKTGKGGDPRAARPVLLFVDGKPQYSKRYGFFEVVSKVHQRRFDQIFREQLSKALASAR